MPETDAARQEPDVAHPTGAEPGATETGATETGATGTGATGTGATGTGADRSHWIALALVVLIVAWMGSGLVGPDDAAPETGAAAGEREPVAVAVRRSVAEPVQRILRAEGEAEPDRETDIPAETGGEVAAVYVRRGAQAAAGDEIARIAPGRRTADLARAEAELNRARRELATAQSLLDRGAGTADRLADARTALAVAEASFAAARESVEDLSIRAPFGGRIERLDAEPGEVVQAGAPVARIVDLDPLSVTIRLPQTAVSEVRAGQPAEVTFIGGQRREGTVVFVGARADTATRTFEAVVEVPNADAAIPAGISASVRIPVGTTRAHFVSPAVLALDTGGTLGVKTVDGDDVVRFHEAEIVRAESDGIWVAGLPEEAAIVTVGQGFVGAGETVRVRDEAELGLGAVRQTAPQPAGATK